MSEHQVDQENSQSRAGFPAPPQSASYCEALLQVQVQTAEPNPVAECGVPSASLLTTHRRNLLGGLVSRPRGLLAASDRAVERAPGLAVSTRSACSSQSGAESAVLRAMGVPRALAANSIRVTFPIQYPE